MSYDYEGLVDEPLVEIPHKQRILGGHFVAGAYVHCATLRTQCVGAN